MSTLENIQQEKKKYWLIFFALVALNIFVVMTRHIPVIFWTGVITAFSIVLMLFMHLKTERKLIHIIIFATVLPTLFGMVLLIVFSNYSVPEGTEYLNFDYAPKGTEHHAPAASTAGEAQTTEHGEHHGS